MATIANQSAPIFTIPLNGNQLFIVDPDNGGSNITRLAFAYVSGTVKVRGNVGKIIVFDADGTTQRVLSRDWILLTSTNAFIAFESSGPYKIKVEVDASAGAANMMGYL